jgi:AraC family transcriptional regulator, ethanolamine operon transcriptional activator
MPMLEAASAPIVSLTVETDDFDELAQGIPGWDAVFSQMSPGPFHGELNLVKLPEVTFYRISTNREILARGAHLPGTFAFSVVTQEPESAIWSGRHWSNDQVIFLEPGGTLDHKTRAQYLAYFVEIEADAFQKVTRTLMGRDVCSDLGGKVLLPSTPAATRRLQAGIRQTLDLARTDADAFREAVERGNPFDDLLRHVAEVICGSIEPEASPGRLRSRRQLVREAEELMDSQLDGTLTVPSLCEKLCVSERGLHYAFQEMLGQSPMAYYRRKRLNVARQRLKRSNPLETTVAETGRGLGFTHGGQFAADYRRLFGEPPSGTLADARRHRRR